ncbi:MAG TPA: ComEC/Rec2 family competence protein [Acidimicrobiia bacterium]|nr:ComEC/Rec2 family competence protein [Acidimicrobiia bacterium]
MTPGPALPVAPLIVLAALVGGIFTGEAAGPGSAIGALVTGALVVVVAVCVRAPGIRTVVAALALALLGAAVMQRALHGIAVSPIASAVATHADARVTATLVDDPDASRFDTRVLVRVDGLDGRTGGGRRVLLTASGDVAAHLRILSAGESVVVRGWCTELEGFDARWRWKHAVGEVHATEIAGVGPARAPLDRVANRLRKLVLAGSTHLQPVDRALLAGFLLGDTRGVPKQLTDQFRAAGLTHLTAVSGENVAFVMALFAPLLRRSGLRGRMLLALAVLVCFGTMTRWEPSVLRAIAMATVALLAGALGRPATGLRVLVLAATALLLVDPFLVHQVGFLLSCGASLGIALLSRPITERLRGPMWMREVLGVTAAAQVGVAPVLVPVFGSMPLVALPANLVAVPLAAPLTMWGLLAGAGGGLARPLSPAVPRLLELPTVGLLHALISVADLAARVPIAIDGRAAWGLIALGALVAAAHRARAARHVEIGRQPAGGRTPPA